MSSSRRKDDGNIDSGKEFQSLPVVRLPSEKRKKEREREEERKKEINKERDN